MLQPSAMKNKHVKAKQKRIERHRSQLRKNRKLHKLHQLPQKQFNQNGFKSDRNKLMKSVKSDEAQRKTRGHGHGHNPDWA